MVCYSDCVGVFFFFFFFFKQKTAYEISACLVGSEMCIRDRHTPVIPATQEAEVGGLLESGWRAPVVPATREAEAGDCLLYTSDAADE